MSYDQFGPDTGDSLMDMPGLSRETKILEKHGDEWKLVYLCYLHHTMHQLSAPIVEVDHSGLILAKSAAAEPDLRSSSSLVIRNGRLAAVERRSNKRLREAIDWAASSDDYLEARRGRVPVVLEAGSGDMFEVCWVTADSGSIFVSLNDRKMGERLQVAFMVYGFSPAESRLAAHLVDGRSLRKSAADLGVTMNTVRTHLRHLFEKTGAVDPNPG